MWDHQCRRWSTYKDPQIWTSLVLNLSNFEGKTVFRHLKSNLGPRTPEIELEPHKKFVTDFQMHSLENYCKSP